MFKIGDIVRPKKGFLGHNYIFKIIKIESTPFEDDLYKLQGIAQKLDLMYGPAFYQHDLIMKAEQINWKEEELELTSNVELRYNVSNLDDINDIAETNSEFLNQYAKKLIKECEVKINKINEEEKEMEILDLYKERKNQLLMNNFYKERQEIIEEDEIQKIKEEMIKQINIILDNEERNEKFETLVPGIAKNVFTKQTQEKINKLEIDLDSEKDKLYNTIQEVRALFELTDDYNERIKILKNYDILDKKGKLNV